MTTRFDIHQATIFANNFSRITGLTFYVVKSRQSLSTYFYLSGAATSVSLRVSDHANPAFNPMRVSDSSDRAEVTDYEWRADQRAGWAGRRQVASWRQIVALICRDLGLTVPAAIAGVIRAETAHAQAEAEREAARQAQWEADAPAREAAAKAEREKDAEVRRQSALIEAEARRLCIEAGSNFDQPKRHKRRAKWRAIAAATLETRTPA